MAAPKIIREKKREIKIRPPPYFMMHEWGRIFYEVSLYIALTAMRKIINHCVDYGKERLEVMGFLIGDVYEWENTRYTVVKDVVTADLDTTSVSVKFKKDAFGKLFHELDKLNYDYVLVGWYHSHPGHTCFMSPTDIQTQKTLFKKDYQAAIVVDPIHREFRSYRLEGDQCPEIGFGVFDDEEEPFEENVSSVGEAAQEYFESSYLDIGEIEQKIEKEEESREKAFSDYMEKELGDVLEEDIGYLSDTEISRIKSEQEKGITGKSGDAKQLDREAILERIDSLTNQLLEMQLSEDGNEKGKNNASENNENKDNK